MVAWAISDLDSCCLLQTDGLMTGVQHGLVELNRILGNKNLDTHIHMHKKQPTNQPKHPKKPKKVTPSLYLVSFAPGILFLPLPSELQSFLIC